MHFELIDEYLLSGTARKAEVIEKLLANRSTLPAAAPFYEGMRMLGARTPDLTLIALRLVLAGRRADDASVVELRGYADDARAGGAGASVAREAYLRMLALIVVGILLASGCCLPASAQTPTPNLYRALEAGPSSHPAREIHGTIESVDYPGGTLVARDASGSQVVAVVPSTAIYRHGEYATLADLHRGQRVYISVYAVGGRLVAQTIRI
jgi:hypothetical protein